MEDETPIIYGLEFQARALSAQTAEIETVRFLVGTQSLKYDNQIHCLEFDEENNLVNKIVFLHTAGEVWHLSASPNVPDIFATCYNQVCSSGKCEMHGAIWKFPTSLSPAEQECVGGEEGPSSLPNLQKLTELETNEYGTEVRNILWHPGEGTEVVSLVDNHILLWDLEASGSNAKLCAKYKADIKGSPKFTAGRWNPHQNCAVVATAIDTAIRGWDIRCMQQAWAIENAHGQVVREFDFNPYRQYYLVSCGDDCQTKFWDIRNSRSPLLTLSNHSHWVWSVRYNHFHDQLILTSSSDSRVILSRVASISSEPYDHLVGDEEEPNEHDKVQVQDAVVATYEEHEDSVYAAEWSTADPWIFASLSYDGRLVINKVPRAEKYRILL